MRRSKSSSRGPMLRVVPRRTSSTATRSAAVMSGSHIGMFITTPPPRLAFRRRRRTQPPMPLFLLGAVLWRAPAAIEIRPGEARRLEVPAITRPARLILRTRLPAVRPAGSLPALRISLNGSAVGPMRDRRTPRLLNKPLEMGPGPFALRWFDLGLWRVAYGPFTTSRDELVLDVADLLRADGANVLALEHAASASSAPVVISELRFDEGAPSPARPRLP